MIAELPAEAVIGSFVLDHSTVVSGDCSEEVTDVVMTVETVSLPVDCEVVSEDTDDPSGATVEESVASLVSMTVTAMKNQLVLRISIIHEECPLTGLRA